MQNKLRRLSYNQLVVLLSFLRLKSGVATIETLEKHTKLKGKSLGGVISSLTRTKFRNISLIEPVGKPIEGRGLRWVLNERLLNISSAKKEVERLLNTYE